MLGGVIDGKYELLRQLGQGGMGVVYEALHLATGRRVAVKLIIVGEDQAASTESVARFQRETRIVGAIDSRHVVQVLDGGIDPATGNPYMVMELLVGEDLLQLIRRQRALAPDLTLRVGAQACAGLQRAHERGITHRDIKSANVFLARTEGEEVLVKILDFGIAKHRADLAMAQSAAFQLTATGTVLGSPLYMSPEQAMGSKDTDTRSDVWSLGVVLYEALCGTTPHAGCNTMGSLIVAICTRPPHPLTELAPWVSPQMAAVVHRALSIDPAQRFPSAAAMREALEAFLPGGSAIHLRMLSSAAMATPAPPSLDPGPGDAAGAARGTLAASRTPQPVAASWAPVPRGTALAPMTSATPSVSEGPAPAPPARGRWAGAALAALAIVGLLAGGLRWRSIRDFAVRPTSTPPSDAIGAPALASASPTPPAPASSAPAPTVLAPAPTDSAPQLARGPHHGPPAGRAADPLEHAAPVLAARQEEPSHDAESACSNIAVCMRDCDQGKAVSCFDLASLYEKGVHGDPPNYRQALTYYKHGCIEGEAKACAASSRLQAAKPSDGPYNRHELEEHVSQCARGNLAGCTFAGMTYANGEEGIPKDPAKALEYYQRGCDGGDFGCCAQAKMLSDKR